MLRIVFIVGHVCVYLIQRTWHFESGLDFAFSFFTSDGPRLDSVMTEMFIATDAVCGDDEWW
jgi:hypothetical protein